MRSRRVVISVIAAFAVLGIAFGFYIRTLYQQLEDAFANPDEFVPTRVYSDLTRIIPPQPRSYIESRLKALGYQMKAAEGELHFTLRPIDYPQFLVPNDHPTLDAGGKPIALQFQGEEQDAPLQSIRVEEQEVPELFLEPELVATLSRAEGNRQIRNKLKFEDIPAMVWQAIIAVEDPRFMEHSGFDPRGIARALWTNLRTGSAHGGSTITQQLVKNLMARRNKNPFLKANELLLSIVLETKWEKEQILERYLNEVYLGQIGSFEIHGVGEGAEHFFGKKIDELKLGEMAFLAGVIRGPGFYSPYTARERALQRQRWVLKRMVENGYIAQAEADQAGAETPRFAPPKTSSNKAPYFADFVKAELVRVLKDKVSEQDIPQAGFRVYTTLDMRLNQAAQEAVATGIGELEKRLKIEAPARLEGALASIDHETGFIRALVGGRSYSQSTFNRILNMKRQVGSTFKPFVYLAALLKAHDPRGISYGPGYPVLDAPWKLTFDGGRQNWSPRNYEKEFKGWTSLRLALAHSINTVAARVGYEVGVDQIIQTAKMLGIESEL
ncbi:MAG TPA: transglycosylase domain-containing protein, partial [Bdellovibrionota bacterium]|nr:transglycosylase domain-containing protein [Bdellovibrionota bacterium]